MRRPQLPCHSIPYCPIGLHVNSNFGWENFFQKFWLETPKTNAKFSKDIASNWKNPHFQWENFSSYQNNFFFQPSHLCLNSIIALSNIEFATTIWENFGEFAGILPNPLTDCKSGIKLSKLGIQIESVARSAGVMPLQFCLLGGLSIVHRAMSGDVSLLIPFNC